VVIEHYPCENKHELLAREGWWQLQKGDVTVNKAIAGNFLSYDTRNEYMKAYYEDNKQHLKNYSKGLSGSKEHKEKVRRSKTTKVLCECGDVHLECSTVSHLKSQKHKEFMTDKTVFSGYVQCECGSWLSTKNYSRHKTTSRHKNLMKASFDE
jgi:hypothetical protein